MVTGEKLFGVYIVNAAAETIYSALALLLYLMRLGLA